MTSPLSAVPRPGDRRQPWLSVPGRWAGIGRHAAQARLALFIAAAVLASVIAAGAPIANPIDGSLDAALADGVRHGGDFHAVAADAARAAGSALSGLAIPLPTLFVLEARVAPSFATAIIMLLTVAVVLAWHGRTAALIVGRRAQLVALLLALIGVAVILRPALMVVPEGWAGLLVAASLARRVPGRTLEPAALGLAAVMLTPAALSYAAVMALAACRERTGREAAGWTGITLAGVIALALHTRAIAALALPGGDTTSFGSGFGTAVAAFCGATGLSVLPVALTAPILALALVGWASRREGVAVRAVPLVALQLVAIAVWAMPNAALIVAPLLPLGLLATPAAFRDLIAAARDRRRITVTRLGKGATR